MRLAKCCPHGHGELIYIGMVDGVDGRKHEVWKCITCSHSEIVPSPNWYEFLVPVWKGRHS